MKTVSQILEAKNALSLEIEKQVVEHDLAENFEIDSNYSIRIDGIEKFQLVSGDDIDEVCRDRRDCVSFDFENQEYFLVKL